MAGKILIELWEFGQSIWLDNISRSHIDSGSLQGLISDGLTGLTSNPTIFDKAISSGSLYDKAIEELRAQGRSTFEIYDELTVRDVKDAAKLFMPVYESTKGMDGYVSLEVNPRLAEKLDETIAECKRLDDKVDMPNVLYKIPATDAGIKATEELLSEGININVTLIFSLEQYLKTAEAYLRAMRKCSARGMDIGRVGSVASVFVSRIDSVVDVLLDEKIHKQIIPAKKEKLRALKGRAAVSNTQIIFSEYKKIFSSEEFLALKAKGARAQRALWGSTSTKNPSYSDIKYVEELIGKGTINTAPDKTIEAFIDHGKVKGSLTMDAGSAIKVTEDLRAEKIDIDQICRGLLEDGVRAFERSFDSLLATIESKSKQLCGK